MAYGGWSSNLGFVGTGRLNLAERTVLLASFAVLLAVLGLLIAGATATTGTLPLHIPHSGLIQRGEIPFMQTVKALDISGGGFLIANHPRTPPWIIAVLVVGFGTMWAISAWLLLRPSQAVDVASE